MLEIYLISACKLGFSTCISYICNMENLIRPKNYAEYLAHKRNKDSITPAYVYKLMKQGKLGKFEIDGVPFVYLEGDDLDNYKQFKNDK